jgi:transcriptional enhancer factor
MNGKTQDVFQKIVNSRKSYKMMKGAAEAVWPPYLEETLLRGMRGIIYKKQNGC